MAGHRIKHLLEVQLGLLWKTVFSARTSDSTTDTPKNKSRGPDVGASGARVILKNELDSDGESTAYVTVTIPRQQWERIVNTMEEANKKLDKIFVDYERTCKTLDKNKLRLEKQKTNARG